eukprot:TRINITY_DN3093_c0_g1_i5.p1 TRINITY_DN3093_c0_g1~~TRINITY_DN3093_c0_g1_i5.p1  ORF type:complete len:481 (-),score=161.09 TRINITY_DN3093_c0_g1_i5:30-1472(-)
MNSEPQSSADPEQLSPQVADIKEAEEIKANLASLSNGEAKAAKEETKEEAKEVAKEEEKKDPRKGYAQIDGDSRIIYSTSVGLAPRSFITFDKEYKEKSPPPTYFSDKELYSCTLITKDDFLKGFEVPREGGLMCVDKSIVKRQSGVIGSMIGQLITTMSISRISLPVRIFESKSTLERIADLWRFAPFFLTKAASTQDKVERFKLVVTFGLAGMYCAMQQLKPFNPLIGETLEATLEDGTIIFIEHTSHHPPISNFYVQGPKDIYKLYGHYEYKVKIAPNSLTSDQDGPNVVEFPDGQRITYHYPLVEIRGLIFGDRVVFATGNMVFEDVENRLKAVIVLDYGKRRNFYSSRKKGVKLDEFVGLIYVPKKEEKEAKGAKKKKEVYAIEDLKDVETQIAKVTGSWLEYIKIGEETYWEMDKIRPLPLKFKEDPLPTDWRYREDLIWLRRENMEIAQEWKVRLEVEQRRDRATRAKYTKKK